MIEKITEYWDGINMSPVFKIIGFLLLAVITYIARIFSRKSVQDKLIAAITGKINKLTKDNLYTNSLFTKHEVYRNKINNIKFYKKNGKIDNVKTSVFKIILSSKLKTDDSVARDFIENTDFKEATGVFICAKMLNTISRMIDVYEELAKTELIKRYGDNGEKVFDYVMNHEIGFRAKRADRVNDVITGVDEFIRNSDIFRNGTSKQNNIEKTSYFLELIRIALRKAIFEAEALFKSLNGEIEEIITRRNDKTKRV